MRRRNVSTHACAETQSQEEGTHKVDRSHQETVDDVSNRLEPRSSLRPLGRVGRQSLLVQPVEDEVLKAQAQVVRPYKPTGKYRQKEEDTHGKGIKDRVDGRCKQTQTQTRERCVQLEDGEDAVADERGANGNLDFERV